MATWMLLLLTLATYVLLGAFLFGVAGRVDLPWIWATLGAFTASHLVTMWVLRHDRGLLRERMRPGPGVPTWDRWLMRFSALLIVGNLVLAALDVGRLHASDTVPVALRSAGLGGLVAGMALMTWAARTNSFFSSAVRIQTDRGHRVVTGGPYRFVRHPGYVGWIVLWSSMQLAVGSWIAFVSSLALAAVVVYRAAREDRFLHDGLDGYRDYAARVPWRLLPGIW